MENKLPPSSVLRKLYCLISSVCLMAFHVGCIASIIVHHTLSTNYSQPKQMLYGQSNAHPMKICLPEKLKYRN